jgi:hypothetical protein
LSQNFDVQRVSKEEFARQMSRREIVFYRPSAIWQNGFIIGNGDFGGTVFGGGEENDGAIGITLNKVDVWDERYDRKCHRYHTLSELRELILENRDTEEGRQKLNSLEPYCMVGKGEKNAWYQNSYPYAYAPPTVKPTGMLRIHAGRASGSYEARLSVHRAEASIRTGEPGQGCLVSTYIDANRNVLVAHIQRSETPAPFAVEFSRYVDETLGEPEIGAEGSAFWHRYRFPDGFVYAVYGIVSEAAVERSETLRGTWRDIQARNGWIPGKRGYMRNWDEEITAENAAVRLTLAEDASQAVVYLGIATSREGGSPLAQARKLAEEAAAQGEAARQGHLDWWDAFWRQSSLMLSDRMVETLWYQGLYALALQSRGSLPPSLIGPGYYLPFAAWHGHYITDFNVEMNYWPIYAANHLELGKPLFDLFFSHLDVMKEETRELYDIDGVKIPGICIGGCRELSYLPCRNWQSSSAWLSQLYWWRYRYSLDETFLRETAYPLMREVAKFYRGYALKGEDGKYHIFPSTPPEQPPWFATDPAIDIALVRCHFEAVLQASEMLGLDEDLRPGWQDLLENLADVPNNGDVFLDHRHATPDQGLGHAGLMSVVFSGGQIGLGSPQVERDMAVRSLVNAIAHTSRKVVDYPLDIPTWNDDCNWPYILLVVARLGLKDEILTYLYDYGIFQHLKPNGLFAFDCPIDDTQRLTRWGMPDSSHAFTAGVSEMLLQSYDGVIRLAPALPAGWDAAISGFLAMGSFLVDAVIAQGKVVRLSIHSQKGGRCRVENPWPGSALQITPDGRQVDFKDQDGILSFETLPGQSFEISPVGADLPEPPAMDLTPGEPTVYTGPTRLGSVPEEQRIAVWLGLR